MGIKGLHKFVSDYSKKRGIDFYRSIPLSRFHGMRVAVDCSSAVYAAYNSSKRKVVDSFQFRFEDGRWSDVPLLVVEEYVCHYFVTEIGTMKSYGIVPVYVFDGVPPIEKADTKLKRKKEQDKKSDELEEARKAGSVDAYKVALLACNVPGRSYKELIAKLLFAMSVEYYFADEEADSLCATLERKGIVDAVLSNDGDQVAYGVGIWLREIKYNRAMGTHVARVGSSAVFRKVLGLSQEALCDWCIMNGTDYNENIRDMGPCHNYAQIKRHGSLEAVVACVPAYARLDFKTPRKIFTTDVRVPEPSPAAGGFLDLWQSPAREGFSRRFGSN